MIFLRLVSRQHRLADAKQADESSQESSNAKEMFFRPIKADCFFSRAQRAVLLVSVANAALYASEASHLYLCLRSKLIENCPKGSGRCGVSPLEWGDRDAWGSVGGKGFSPV